MQRKVFLNRKPKSSGAHSYPKVLLWAALGLMVLVLLTPLLTRKPTHKTVPNPAVTHKGTVFAKIPKAASREAANQAMQFAGIKPAPTQQGLGATETAPAGTPSPVAAENSSSAAPAAAAKPAVPAAPVPADSKPPVAADSAGLAKDDIDHAPAAPVPASASAPPQAVKPAAPAAASAPPVPAQKPVAGAASHSLPAAPVKAAPTRERQPSLSKAAPPQTTASGAGLEYIVRVGSFRNLQNAEKLQKILEKKGYAVVIKPYQHPTLGLLHIVELRPIHNAEIATSMMRAIRTATHDKPMLIKVSNNR